ncbi:MAG: ribonuclease HII [Candidatus Methanomethylophilus sp.]|nr:ribonuclease HII [Methanomethylophilus sp.]MDD3232717.1 ribonuclease HII [Methanomethylophilus sp.]MDD4221865.1 ribonuclease HII [Methanomethylophilus sp.]MDD4668402.1 ribonuclease HII [Methanomethylophilus sp.]
MTAETDTDLMFCGVDEAGRGPMFGPLVVGAVWCEDQEVLHRLGVKDSKKLTPIARERLYDEIAAAAAAWCTVPIAAEEIDTQMARKSLNDIELDLFVEAVGQHPADLTYADCPDVNTERFGSVMSARLNGRTVVAAHKADDTYPAVSAASVMAKVTRDRMLDDLRKEFKCPIGSGYPSDAVTVAFIEKWINKNGSPPPHTRCSWEPVRHLIAVRHNTKISDW